MSRCRSLPALLAALLLAGLLPACGAVHQVRGGSLALSVSEWRVTPDNVAAHPGALLIVVYNSGRLAHDLVLSDDGGRVAATPPIMPGHSAQVLASLHTGSYQLSSSMVDDQATGIYGTLNVG